ncbi:MAG: hypothetical protein WDW38_010418 [Sanguina aurantia]
MCGMCVACARHPHHDRWVVSDYLTAYDGEEAFIKSNGQPVAVYTYKVAFLPAAPKQATPAASLASAGGKPAASAAGSSGSSGSAAIVGSGVADVLVGKPLSPITLWDEAVQVSAGAYAP